MELKRKSPKIIELMGKENKKQTKKTHQAILTAFSKPPEVKRNGETPGDS